MQTKQHKLCISTSGGVNVNYLDTTNTEFDQRSEHFSAGDFVGCALNGDLDKQTVVMRLIEKL